MNIRRKLGVMMGNRPGTTFVLLILLGLGGMKISANSMSPSDWARLDEAHMAELESRGGAIFRYDEVANFQEERPFHQ